MAVEFADERHYLDYEGLNQFMDKLNKNFRTRFKYKGELYIASETRENWDDLIPAAVGNLYVLKADELVPDPDNPGQFLPPSPTSVTIDGVDYEVGDTIYVTNRVQDAPDPADPDAVHVTVNKISSSSGGLVIVDELPPIEDAKKKFGYVLKDVWYDEENKKHYYKGTYTVNEEEDPVTGEKILSWATVGHENKNAYTGIQKLAPYLYKTDYCGIDFSYAKYLDDVIDYGGCLAALSENKIFLRNFDFMYDETAYFVVNVNDEVLGMAGAIPGLTQEFVDSGDYSMQYDILPIRMLDGINKNGLTMAILMSPYEEGVDVPTTGTNPMAATTLNAAGAVSWILSRGCKTIWEAWTEFNKVNWYVSDATRATGHEVKFAVSDPSGDFALFYFKNNNALNMFKISTVPPGENSDFGNTKLTTNFNDWNAESYPNGTAYTPENAGGVSLSSKGYSLHASGMERFNAFKNNVLPYVTPSTWGYQDYFTFRRIRDYTEFSKAYTGDMYSDLIGDDTGLNVDSSASDFVAARDIAHSAWVDRERDGTFWQTVYTSAYDIRERKLVLLNQEEFYNITGINYNDLFKFNLPFDEKVVKKITRSHYNYLIDSHILDHEANYLIIDDCKFSVLS